MATPEKPSAIQGGKILEKLPEIGEASVYTVLPMVEAFSFFAKGKDFFAGITYGTILAFGVSFVLEMIKGLLQRGIGGGGGGGGH